MPRVLDLYCGAGGAGMGYRRAGFEVTGVDHLPQKRYPFEFARADAFSYLLEHGKEFDLIHASPPCQAYSTTKGLATSQRPRHILLLRDVLRATGKPYVIENVPGSPLADYVMLCGTMFDLRVQRHRFFECRPHIFMSPRSCNHWGKFSNNLETGDFISVAGNGYHGDAGREAMGIDWMSKAELSQAVPPAYTEWLGKEIRRMLKI